MITLARSLDIKYASLLKWIHSDPERDKKYKEALSARAEWAMERVLQEIQLLGTVDIRQAYGSNGELLSVKDMPDDIARALQGVEVEEIFAGFGADRGKVGETKKIKLIDKLKALELMGKNFGMFIDRKEINLGAQTLEALVSGSMPALPPPAAVETTLANPE